MEKETKGMTPTVNIEEFNIYFGESNSNYYEKPRFIPKKEEDVAGNKSEFFRKLANTELLDAEDLGEESIKIDDDSVTTKAEKPSPGDDETEDDSDSDLSDEEVEEFLKEIFGNQSSRRKGRKGSNDSNSSDEKWVIRITKENHQAEKGECHGRQG